MEKYINEIIDIIIVHKQNDKQIEGLTMYLQACKDRVEERINRGVMGELKK